MRKSSCLCFMFAVMIMLCLVRWTALADVIDPEIFIRDEPGASFDLTASQNAITLTISPHTSGYYSYSFAIMSADTQHTQESADSYYAYGESEDVSVSFIYDVPDEGEILRYGISASFFPSIRREDVPAITSEDRPLSPDNNAKSSGGGSCSIYDDNYGYYIVQTRYISAYFTASADVRNVNGSVYVEIHKGD